MISLRAWGRSGLFALAVVRASAPTPVLMHALVKQLHAIGGRTLPILATGGAFVGLVLTLQGYRTLTTFGASSALSTLLGLSLYRELGPVLSALLFIGRAGSSIAAELGLMRATEQIAALSMMAIDPMARLVVPRVWAATIALPLLTAFFIAFALAAGYLEATLVLGLDGGTFWSALTHSVHLRGDFGITFLKAAIFGVLSALIATEAGFHAEPSIEGTARATTRAVVSASLWVLVFNFLLSALLFQR